MNIPEINVEYHPIIKVRNRHDYDKQFFTNIDLDKVVAIDDAHFSDDMGYGGYFIKWYFHYGDTKFTEICITAGCIHNHVAGKSSYSRGYYGTPEWLDKLEISEYYNFVGRMTSEYRPVTCPVYTETGEIWDLLKEQEYINQILKIWHKVKSNKKEK